MIAPLLEKLQRHDALTTDEAANAMAAIMRGEVTAAQIAGLLMALRSKGERPEELVGLARAMREAAVPLPVKFTDVFDTCGTGGDNLGTVNVSSMAAVVVAACGVRVAKHGNRSVSSRSGSADVFEALGVNVAATPEVVARCLQDALRANDRIGRMGGDEFAIVLPEIRSDDCMGLVQRVRQISPMVIDLIPTGSARVGLSLGIASAEPGESFEVVLARADAAMYEDKRRQKRASESLGLAELR